MSEAKKRLSPEERLADLDKRMEQLKAKKQKVQQQISQKERKERTRRLIQIGAIFEKQFPTLEKMSLDEVSQVAEKIRRLVEESASRRTETLKEKQVSGDG